MNCEPLTVNRGNAAPGHPSLTTHHPHMSGNAAHVTFATQFLAAIEDHKELRPVIKTILRRIAGLEKAA